MPVRFVVLTLVAVLLPVVVSAKILKVTKSTDSNSYSGDYNCSLRDAIQRADDGDVIILYDGTSPYFSSIDLTFGSLIVNKKISIDGTRPEWPFVTSIRATSPTSVIWIPSSGQLTLTNVTVSGGVDDKGGGIRNDGNLTMLGVSVFGNSAHNGGGLYNTGILNATNCTFRNNTAQGSSRTLGGGIYNIGPNAIATITNSTIAYNEALSQTGGGYGGGISSSSAIRIVNTTIANNRSSHEGGGIYTENVAAALGNSIVATNSSDRFSYANDITGNIDSQGYNLIQSFYGTIFGNSNGNIYGLDPQFTRFGNNGGITETFALTRSSPVVDKGNSSIGGTTIDQRGRPRIVDLAAFANADGGDGTDIGSVEFQKDALFDFDSDGKSDVSVFRPSNNTWYLNRSQVGFAAFQFGANGDLLTPADFTGDGKTDIAVFRPSAGTWFVMRSEDNTFYGAGFGTNGDIPAPADYDGDGKADQAVFRPSNGTWYLQQSTVGFSAVQFGASADKPAVGDFDGDGKSDISVYRPSNGYWYRLNSANGSFVGIQFGAAGDKIVPADYTGDGKTDIAVWRPSNGTWYVLRSEDLSFYGAGFGLSSDLPAPGDYDGDGKADIAVYRPSQGTWYMMQSTSAFNAVQFGIAEDRPTPGAFVY